MKKVSKVLLIIFVFILSGCNRTKINELPKNYYIKVINKEIQVYSKIKLKDIIDTNIPIDNKLLVDTKMLGNNKYKIKFKIKRTNYIYEINYNVVDKEEPKVVSSIKTVKLGYENDLCDLIEYGDNYDKTPTCSVLGEYDTKTVGSYNVTYVIKDNSLNELKYNINLNVIENSKSTIQAIPKKKLFNDIYKEYKMDNNMIGIDISKWQGKIDFKAIKDSGCEFVIIRIGVQKSIGKSLEIDPRFLEYYGEAKKHGLKIGVYLYSMASSDKEAKEQAKWVIDKLRGKNIDMPVVLDWENFDFWNEFKISFYDLNSISYRFFEALKEKNYKVMLYSSKNYLDNIWDSEYKYPVWLAHYTSKTNYEGNYKMWQLCNDARIDGINNDVDVNIYYK